MRGQGGTRLLAGGYVPQLYGPVGTPGGQQVSVRAEGYGVDRRDAAGERYADQLVGSHVP